jgi:acetyl-CoA synthetase
VLGDQFQDHPSRAPEACVASLLCDRHDPGSAAFLIVGPDGRAVELSFGELRERSERVAGGLASLGIGRGDRVATLMGKGLDLVTAQLAIWRLGAVYIPLFTAFGPGAIGDRLRQADAKAVICDGSQREKLEPSAALGGDPSWLVISTGARAADGDTPFDDLLDAPAFADPARIGPDGTMCLLYTSGTTGAPKGVPIPVRAMAAFECYLEYGLDVRADDTYWNMADPGWAYGLYYAVIAPLVAGRRSLLLESTFSVDGTWSTLAELGVTNFAAAPTVYRALRNSPQPNHEVKLRCASSAGEPLNADLVDWSRSELGVEVHDHYGQTELGMVLGNHNHPDAAAALKPGSMGRALPGWKVDVLAEDAEDILGPGQAGRLAVDVPASPLMWFTGYLDRPEATAERFSEDRRWYFTGDVAARDEDGYLFFSGRDDDVIIMAGYRIGPLDIESVLVQHDGVAEAACVGVKDELRGELLEAFVVLLEGVEPSAELAAELQERVKQGYAAHAYPRRVHFVDELPKTPSGKVQRFKLRRRAESGQQAGPADA